MFFDEELSEGVGGSRYFIGIDESDHGSDREVVVAASSTNPRHIKRRRPQPKIRDGRGILQVVNLNCYRFLVLENGLYRSYENLAVRAAVIACLIHSFQVNPAQTIVLIDGGIKAEIKDRISQDLYTLSGEFMPRGNIRYQPRADERFPLVRKADTLAYALNQVLREDGEDGLKPYASSRASLVL